MSVPLKCTAGPLEGRAYDVSGEATLGRDPSNTVFLKDGSVSRYHCVIRTLATGHSIQDLDSRNGTFVNGRAIEGVQPLRPGDRIQTGVFHFVFDPDRAPAAQPSVTMLLRATESRYLREQPATESSDGRIARDLGILFRFARALGAMESETALHEKLLELALEAIPADRVALVQLDPDNPDSVSVSGRDRRGSDTEPSISRTIVTRVLSERAAMLTNEIPDDLELASAESLAIRLVHSVLAVPLEARGRITAVLYLESGHPGVQFDHADLELASALGGIASAAISGVRKMESLAAENERLRGEIDARHGIVGASAPVKAVLSFVDRAGPTNSTVLIWGESGTGKELVARAIHRAGPRKDGPFVPINCAAITETLLESEIFGHEKGAFTGAVGQKKGKIEMAEGGTIFFDEIGEMALALQAKLLRVLQEREFERVGGNKTVKADVRVVAATNRDLKEMSKTGAFRLDLYYRLNVLSIRTPALRERRDDIPLLADHFTAHSAAQTKRRVRGVSKTAMARLVAYDWPGNIRELQNVIERAVVLGASDRIEPEDLTDLLLEAPPSSPAGAPAPSGSAAALPTTGPLHDRLNEVKRWLIQREVDFAGGNITEAARRLEVHPTALFRTMKQLGMK